jgi:hypothetical protein
MDRLSVHARTRAYAPPIRYQNMPMCRPFACRTKSGLRTTLLASRARTIASIGTGTGTDLCPARLLHSRTLWRYVHRRPNDMLRDG